MPAKSVNKKNVEDYPRNNKTNVKQANHVDSSISYKRTVVQIVLWYLDSGCSKQMTGNRSRLKNFMKKFTGTVQFGNDHFGAIMGYGDYVIDLEVAFRKHSCYVRDTDGVELLEGSHGSNLYTISVEDMMKSSPICLLSKSSKNKSWLWHRRLNNLNFDTINDLARKDLNGVVERRNRTLVEAAKTMLIFSKALMFLWAEAMATAYYTQNRSLIHTLHNKTPYELVHDKKYDLTFFCVFGALCYPTNDNEDLGNYNQQLILEYSLGSYQIRFLEPTRVERPVSPAQAVLVSVSSAGTPSSTTNDQDAPSPSHSPSSSALQSLSLHQGVAAESTLMENNPFAPVANDPFINVFDPEPSFEESSSGDLSSAESPYVTQTLHHLGK
ncbi:integrase, catalytic region, zinc finger, CCHC-type containing protein [Tanacetum coccineum]